MFPSNLITQTVFNLEVEDENFEFIVHHTVYGEVLKVENAFLQLPKTAQALMYKEKKREKIIKKLEFQTAIFRFLVPIAVLGYMERREWEKFEKAVKKLENEIPNFQEQEKKINDPWVIEAHNIHEEEEYFYALSTLAGIGMLGAPSRQTHHLPQSLVQPMLLTMLPHFEKDTDLSKSPQRGWSELWMCFSAFQHCPNEEIKAILMKRLFDEKYKNYWDSILKGLRPYTDKQTGEQLLLFYHQHKDDFTGSETRPLVSALKNFDNPETRTILWKILVSEYSYAAVDAYLALNEWGISDKQIIKKVRPNLIAKTSLEHVESALKVYKHLKNRSIVPTIEEMIETLVWACETTESSHFVELYLKDTDLGAYLQYYFKYAKDETALIHRVNSKDAFEQFAVLLEHKSPYVRQATVDLLLQIATPEQIDVLLKMFDDIEPDVGFTLIENLKYWVSENPVSKIIPFLLRVIKKSDDEDRQLQAILALRTLFEQNPDYSALPAILKSVHHKSARIRNWIADLLRYLPNKKTKRVLKKMQKDESEAVAETARKSLDYIKNPELFKAKAKELHEEIIAQMSRPFR